MNIRAPVYYYFFEKRGVTRSGNTEMWNSLAPKNVRSLLNNTRERLAKRGVTVDAICPFDWQTDEILTHLLFSCPHLAQISCTCSKWAGLTDFITNTSRVMLPAQGKDWATFFIAIAWNVWQPSSRPSLFLH
jgi:hypothetical protein